jgi:hypothetical protein
MIERAILHHDNHDVFDRRERVSAIRESSV